MPFNGGFPGPSESRTENDSTDEEEDVDFWGGESPRERTVVPNREAIFNEPPSDGDDSDEEDEVMDDECMTADDDDEDEDDHMELFGHR
jgi:hypothetical protein